jgi:hypothetical protein
MCIHETLKYTLSKGIRLKAIGVIILNDGMYSKTSTQLLVQFLLNHFFRLPFIPPVHYDRILQLELLFSIKSTTVL